MKCSICGRGETKPSSRTITLEHRGTALTVRDVPAEICEFCGEDYLDDRIALRLLKCVEAVSISGADCVTRDFALIQSA